MCFLFHVYQDTIINLGLIYFLGIILVKYQILLYCLFLYSCCLFCFVALFFLLKLMKAVLDFTQLICCMKLHPNYFARTHICTGVLGNLSTVYIIGDIVLSYRTLLKETYRYLSKLYTMYLRIEHCDYIIFLNVKLV